MEEMSNGVRQTSKLKNRETEKFSTSKIKNKNTERFSVGENCVNNCGRSNSFSGISPDRRAPNSPLLRRVSDVPLALLRRSPTKDKLLDKFRKMSEILNKSQIDKDDDEILNSDGEEHIYESIDETREIVTPKRRKKETQKKKANIPPPEFWW